MGDVFLPADWPEAVEPPGAERFEESAVAWLLEVVPEYRRHPVVCRFPAILAAIARHTVQGALEGTRQGYRVARTEMGEAAPPHAVDGALIAYRTEGRRLAATARAVELVERALHGETFTRTL